MSPTLADYRTRAKPTSYRTRERYIVTMHAGRTAQRLGQRLPCADIARVCILEQICIQSEYSPNLHMKDSECKR